MSGLETFTLIASILAVLGVIFGIAYWKGVVDTKIKQVSDIPGTVTQLKLKVDVIWQLFVEQVLERSPRLANRGSRFVLTPEGEKCLEEITNIIEEVCAAAPQVDSSDALTIIAQRIGMAQLREIASKNGCTPAEYMAILTIKLGVEI